MPPVDKIPIEILRDQLETAVSLYGGIPDQSIAFHDDEIDIFVISAKGQKSEYEDPLINRPPNCGVDSACVRGDIATSKTIKLRTFEVPSSRMIFLYAHGGGWIRGNLNTHHVMCQNLAKATQCTVIAIDYSLSPEHPYPTAIDEIEEVYKWATKTKTLPISLAGDSAGANLMASLIVRLNQQNITLPHECIFFYPALDLTQRLDSLNEFAEGYLLTKHSIQYSINAYLANNEEFTILPDVSPLWFLENIDFPPTFIIAAEVDPLRDDSRIAKNILEKKGKLKGYLEVPGVLHGFAQLSAIFPEAAQSFNWISKFYKA